MGCCKVTDLRHKEVINSRSGCRLGCVDDVEVDTVTAKLVSLIIFGRPRFFGLFGRYEDLVLKWECIDLIGEDTILVNCCPPKPHRTKRNFRIPFLSARF